MITTDFGFVILLFFRVTLLRFLSIYHPSIFSSNQCFFFYYIPLSISRSLFQINETLIPYRSSCFLAITSLHHVGIKATRSCAMPSQRCALDARLEEVYQRDEIAKPYQQNGKLAQQLAIAQLHQHIDRLARQLTMFQPREVCVDPDLAGGELELEDDVFVKPLNHMLQSDSHRVIPCVCRFLADNP